MHRILVGYDGSEPAAHALDQAALIARAYNAPLTILTAADDRMVREDGHKTMAADEDLAQWTANQGAERARRSGLEQVDTQVSIEAPIDSLVHLSKEGGYDLVVVGYQGHRPVREFFLGSTAKTLVDRVECSVLIVR